MKGRVRIIETGEIVEVYIWYANGIGYIGKNGIRFVPEGQYEIINNIDPQGVDYVRYVFKE